MSDKTPETKTETVRGIDVQTSGPVLTGGAINTRNGVNANLPAGLGRDPKDVKKKG